MEYIIGNNLGLGYEGKEFLSGLSFQVGQGDYLCIVGENGAGKSTLVKTILGLMEPVSGEIVFADETLKKEIGYLPQQTIVQQDFPATVEEIVLSGCQGKMGFRPFYNKKEKCLAQESMGRMGITALTKCCYRKLSGGQQQRVLLARALCATDKILLLDEPVAGLDPKVTADMYSLIKDLNNEGITIIMISHDIDAALEYSSHILHVGKNYFYGTREEYLSSEMGKRFLAINRMDDELSKEAKEVSGC